MTIDPEVSSQLIYYLSNRDNPVSVNKAIDFILLMSLTPELDKRNFENLGC